VDFVLQTQQRKKWILSTSSWKEHRRILTVLDALDRFSVTVEDGASCDREQLGRFVKFIREYADGYHHAKEEDILFDVMEQHGFSKQAGPVAVMLWEHDEGRKLVSFLNEAASEPQDLTTDESLAVCQSDPQLQQLTQVAHQQGGQYPLSDGTPADSAERQPRDDRALRSGRR